MALDTNNSYLSMLVDAGADAQSNLYLAEFSCGTGSPNTNLNEADVMNLAVRCKGFTPPAVSQDEYNVKFITAQIDRPAAKVKVDRQFSLEFRVDANYEAYKILLAQQGVTFNAANSFVATDIKTLIDEKKLCGITIKAITQGVADDADTPTVEGTELFKFENCWISEIEPLKFDSSNSKPLEVRITCKYLQGQDIASGLNM